MIDNETYIKEYIESRGLSENSYKALKVALKHYSNYQGLTLHELIHEADKEEEDGIRWKRRTLKKRLINYTNHLRKTLTINSAKTYLKIVKSFYNHNEIEIHKLPPINEKNSITVEPIQYKDLPTRKIIKKALGISNPLMKALILFLSSSGMSKVDALQLTINDFIKSTTQYHHSTDLHETITTLQQLADKVDIIPSWHCRRQKTSKYFITFCSHEATIEILNYLQERSQKYELKETDKLFKIDVHYYNRKFKEINDALNLGKVGSYNRFRGHMLRKFHASNLAKAGMDRYLINVLQGKSNGKVDDVYFFEDENQLREEYIKHMHSLLIFSEVREVTVHSEEFLELQKENSKLKEQLTEIEQMQKEIDKIKEWFVLED